VALLLVPGRRRVQLLSARALSPKRGQIWGSWSKLISSGEWVSERKGTGGVEI
jgi:hypothetical protein